MKTKRLKISIKTIILIISLIIFASISVITFAWFKDKEEYTGSLNFGSIELDITSGVVEATKTIDFDITRSHGDYSSGGNIMPGDIINIPLKIKLKNSEPAYYLVYLTDTKKVFEEAMYFSDDGTNVYVNNGIKTYKQGTTTVVTNKIVGKISGTSEHAINIKAEIPLSFNKKVEKTEVTCKIMAIQQANLTESAAENELLTQLDAGYKYFYEEKEYIESSEGNYPYIDTGIAPTSNMRFVGDVYFQRPTNGNDIFLFMVGEGYKNFNGLMITTARGVYFGTGTSSGWVGTLNETLDFYRFNFEYSYNVETLKAELKSNYGNFSKTYNSITLFDGNFKLFGEDIYRGYWQMRCYSFKIYDNDILVRDYIPCVRKSDNKPGLYDKVSKTFFTNAGTSADFLWG